MIIIVCTDKRDGLSYTKPDTPDNGRIVFVYNTAQMKQVSDTEPNVKHIIVITDAFQQSEGYTPEFIAVASKISGKDMRQHITFITIDISTGQTIIPVVGWNVSIDSDVPGPDNEWPVDKSMKVCGWFLHADADIATIFFAEVVKYDKVLFICNKMAIHKPESKR